MLYLCNQRKEVSEVNDTGFHPSWYGNNFKLVEQHPGYSIISYQCNGTGILHDYALFPGIDLVFMDFNCSDVFEEPCGVHNILELRHYHEGRIEFEFNDQKVFHLQQDEFCINAMVNMPARYAFPFEYCHGLSLIIDRDVITRETSHLFLQFKVDLSSLTLDLDAERQWYICKTPAAMVHIFDELYASKGIEPVEYFRIKTLELLYFASQLRVEDRINATYYSKGHIDIVKRVRKHMLSDLSSRRSLESLLQNEPVSTVTFQAVFKQVYGHSPYSYLKYYKMNYAAVRLRESGESINQIAISLGYSNASKFSKAFQDVFGMLPKDYRAKNKVI